MIKITGYLIFVDKYGNHVKESKTFKKWGIRAKIFYLKMILFYDLV